MAIETIDLGTEPLGTDGDTARAAFTKVNANFAEQTDLIEANATSIAAAQSTADDAATAAAAAQSAAEAAQADAGDAAIAAAAAQSTADDAATAAAAAQSTADNAGEAAGAAQTAADAAQSAADAAQAGADASLKIAEDLADLHDVATARTNLGLGNVSNTADADKPVSTAQQAALDDKEDAGIAESLLDAHVEASDPHEQYFQKVGGEISGAVQFTGTGLRFLADFSNPTFSDRMLFQSSVENSVTSLGLIPNGTNNSANISLFSSENPSNCSVAQFAITATELRLTSTSAGSGTVLPLQVWFGSNQRAIYYANGNLIFGATSLAIDATTNTGIGMQRVPGLLEVSRAAGECLALQKTGSDGLIASFWRQTSSVGSISVTSSATAYNTASDYRLKENPQPLQNSGAFIDALQPKTWTWKVDGSAGIGFIADEVQAISPTSVTGEKDAVDTDGKPVYQSMEYGSPEFIANIIAELQSLRLRVAALEQGHA